MLTKLRTACWRTARARRRHCSARGGLQVGACRNGGQTAADAATAAAAAAGYDLTGPHFELGTVVDGQQAPAYHVATQRGINDGPSRARRPTQLIPVVRSARRGRRRCKRSHPQESTSSKGLGSLG